MVLEAGTRSRPTCTHRAAAAFAELAALTGESVPVPVDRGDELFAGTFLARRGGCVRHRDRRADATAGIAALAATAGGRRHRHVIELHRLVRTVAWIAVGVGSSFFLLALLIGIELGGSSFAIGVVVALVPEGLLPTVTLSLAIGAQRMAERHARSAGSTPETLGSTTFICTDKTGTLTRNEMAVVEVWTPAGAARIDGVGYEPDGRIDAQDRATEEAVRRLARVAVRCSTGHADLQDGRWVAIGDPMDAAVGVLARRLGLDPAHDRQRWPEVARFPFDPRRRLVSIATEDRIHVKGAPDAVLPRCVDVSARATSRGRAHPEGSAGARGRDEVAPHGIDRRRLGGAEPRASRSHRVARSSEGRGRRCAGDLSAGGSGSR